MGSAGSGHPDTTGLSQSLTQKIGQTKAQARLEAHVAQLSQIRKAELREAGISGKKDYYFWGLAELGLPKSY